MEVVNETLIRPRDACDGCIALTWSYPDEPRGVVATVDWERLRRIAWAR